MENPIRRIKREKGFTNRQIAILLEQSVGNVSHLLNGNFSRITEKTLKVFEKFGYDPKKIQKEYAAYRKSEAEKIYKRIKAQK